ncbi:hypothetical protein GB937_002550 [Aspergillus fischeri]|nr:hypothetical protein GB937_002550 [Aspergillus fischeri]
MLRRLLQHLKLHPHLNNPLIPRRTQHPKAGLILDPLIHPAVRHQRIPRLPLMLLRRIRINIRHLAPRTARHNIQVQLGPNPDRLPRVLRPRHRPPDDDIRPEPLNGNRLHTLPPQPLVQLRQGRLGGNLHGMHVGEVCALLPAQEARVTVPLQDARHIALQEPGERGVDGVSVEVSVCQRVPDLDLGEGGGVWAGGDLDFFCGSGDAQQEGGAVVAEAGVDQCHLGDLADGEELMGFGVYEHPLSVEV